MSDREKERPRRILPLIIVSQFAGTSLWFASNAILPDLQRAWGLHPESAGSMTSSVQFGFILGTLLFAFLTLSDRFSPRKLFFFCSLLGSIFNISICLFTNDLAGLLFLRFLTGMCLAGIYPVGMKIASGWYREGMGNALGFLVGALVLGTAFPHLLRSLGQEISWREILLSISIISAAGGLLMLILVPDGPYIRSGTPFTTRAMAIIFHSRDLRAAAFGYFGHMWELYTLYTFIPFILAEYAVRHPHQLLDSSLWSFVIIAAGSIGCVGGGLLSRRAGSARIAGVQLACSGVLCVCSPWIFSAPAELFLAVLILWGVVVVGDSPQFSALIARHAPPEFVGSALTISNCIGFTLTIFSIQLTAYLSKFLPPEFLFVTLAIGPVIGLFCFSRLLRKSPAS